MCLLWGCVYVEISLKIKSLVWFCNFVNIRVNSISKIVMSVGWDAIRGSNNIICFIFKTLQFYPKIFTIGILNIVFLNGFKLEEWFQTGMNDFKGKKWFQSENEWFQSGIVRFRPLWFCYCISLLFCNLSLNLSKD